MDAIIWFFIVMAIIFTSPFWMILGVVLIASITSLIETFLNLLRKR